MLTVITALYIAWLMPPQDPHQTMNDRGAMVMGFDQDKTAHHFYLYEDGGAIDIAVKDPADTKNRDAIRAHLPHIAMMFGTGDFDAPMLVHDSKDVPGTAVLAKQNGQGRLSVPRHRDGRPCGHRHKGRRRACGGA